MSLAQYFDPFDEGMKLTLTYRGELPSGSNNSHKPVKWKMRSVFHYQLKQHWQSTAALNKYNAAHFYTKGPAFPDPPGWFLLEVGNFTFVPLVIRSATLKLICHLDVELLARSQIGYFFNSSGDLDNRLKILFDALRAPKHENELQAQTLPASDQKPFYVLLEDDILITRVSIETRRLLRAAIPPETDPDVELNIKAEILAAEDSVHQFPY